MATSSSNTTDHVATTPRGVTFAQPIADYRPHETEAIEYSSSSDESDINSTFYNSVNGSQVQHYRSERGLLEFTYLERIDYRALLASLRTNEAHDTAKHLLTVAMLKRLPASQYQVVTDKKLRSSWTAWPLPPDQTRHSVKATSELNEQLRAALHRSIAEKLREHSKQISADELPEDVLNPTTNVILSKLNTLLEAIGQLRSGHGGGALSTVKRLNPMQHEDIAVLLKDCQILSQAGVDRVLERAKELFGEPAKIEQSATDTEATPVGSPLPVAEEVALGPGHWSTRGYKRRRILDSEEQSTPTKSTQARRKLKMEQVTSDSGQRFGRDIRLVPAHLIKQERSEG
ncbi:protein of unknown function [Taphrina deformans PYCC 5710]|uniref:Rrn9 domain-containing protein n=1 Tax=Taphrina deformans (strain PYCC 5710 / ATCC 11124 / CBS 356.35 / IMI 108563 / JCM 9778 / NBRC 8474) TaxID=1097556 RepID=R4XBU3_TAPDE|nr:protein of unknown function [Taphrina deformans PYCC 5710]|eukprot:CCG81846.1 protein of unknown function [Taphrina deformans PYCC 5710]